MHHTKHQYSISPPNQWPIRVHKPAPGTVPLDLYWLPSTKLGITPSTSSVHTQHVAQHHHKKGTIWINHGTHPLCPPICQDVQSPPVETHLQQIKQAWEEAMEALQRAADVQAPAHFKPYQTGDLVWLEGHNLNATHSSSKLAPRHYGPFPITCVISHTSDQLKLPPQWKIHNVFHATLLTLYKEMSLNGQCYQEPTPDLIDGQPEWEVKSILQVRKCCNQLQFLIWWKGFSEAHDSWEPASNVWANELGPPKWHCSTWLPANPKKYI